MRVPPSAVINLIRENLRDRYLNDFHIVQELVQNADDAGAVTFEIGWCRCIPSATHPLLQGPGLFAGNDGEFTAKDSEAINCIAISSKTGDKATIGKFGLGLKSVFHLGEVFFYATSARAGIDPGVIVVNPWADANGRDRYHSGWDNLSEADQAALHAYLSHFLNQRWSFCLYVPLRQALHCPAHNPITPYYVGDEPARLSDNLFASPETSLADLLPLLRSITTASGWYPNSGEEPELAFRLQLDEPSLRRRLPDLPNEGARFSIAGRTSIRRYHPTAGNMQCRYGGIEEMVASPVFARLRNSGQWPKSSSTDPDTGAYKPEEDKAVPHAAVCFMRHPGTVQPPSLAVVQAVFLPVRPYEPDIPCSGKSSFSMVLHGYFFVDAGRSRIDDWNEPSLETGISDEGALRRHWNRALAHYGTLALVLPALETFARTAELARDEITNLTEAIQKSRLFEQNKNSLCARQQWICRLGSEGPEWQLFDASAVYYQVPAQGAVRASQVFPPLSSLAGRHYITDAGWPRLCIGDPQPWPAELLERLIQGLPADSVFVQRAHLEYVVSLLEGCCSPETLQSANIVDALKIAAREGLLAADFTQLRRYAEVLRRFLRFLPREQRFAVGDRSALWDRVIRELLKIDLGVLVVPDGLDDGDGGQNVLGHSDAVKMLSALGRIREQLAPEKDIDAVCHKLALRVIQATGADRQQILADCEELALFQLSIEGVHSWKELQQWRSRATLFSAVPSPLLRPLQQALQAATVATIDPAAAATLFGEGQIQRCDERTCIQALLLKPALANVEERIPLLGSLHNQALTPGYRAAVRYLMHGRVSDDDSDLFIGRCAARHSVWIKLVRQVMDRQDTSWRIVPESLANSLPPQAWVRLGLDDINPKSVVGLIRQFGPSHIDCQVLTTEERDAFLREIGESDLDVLRSLSIHEDLDGALRPIVPGITFLDGAFRQCLDAIILRAVQVIRAKDEGSLYRKQRLVMSELDPTAAIQVALRLEHPAAHWRVIMDALAKISLDGSLPADLGRALCKRPWLPTAEGQVIAPEDVIHIPGMEQFIAELVPGLGAGLVDTMALLPELRAHRGFARLTEIAFPNLDDALAMLGEGMAERGDYHIGPLGAPGLAFEDFLDVFKDAPPNLLPARTVLVAADQCQYVGRVATVGALVPILAKPLAPSKTVDVLNHLASQHAAAPPQRKDIILKAHAAYLTAGIVDESFRALVLPKIKLLNRAKRWKSPEKLCVGIIGIADEDLLSEQQESILHAVLPESSVFQDARSGGSSKAHTTTTQKADDLPQLWDLGVERVCGYFKEWEDAVDAEVIGGFLALLGDHPDMRKLAGDFLGNHDIDRVRGFLNWTPLDLTISGGRIGGYGQGVLQAMAYQRFVIEIVDMETDNLRVTSLLGTPFTARLGRASELQTILVGSRLWDFPRSIDQRTGCQSNQLQLRRIRVADEEGLSRQKLSELLRESARLLLNIVYSQTPSNLDDVWNELAQSEQLDIRTAQNLLLDSAFFYLRQLGIQKNEKVRHILGDWEDARRQQVEEEQARKLRGSLVESAKIKMEQAREALRTLVEQDAEAQSFILQSVRDKVRQYQYRRQAIPFELFQNADDAVVELADMAAGEAWEPDQAPFVVAWTRQSMDFVHWGRPINEFRHGAFHGQEGRARGYDRDLEKMLILSYSDKVIEQETMPITGKFGLGFKSVFLVSDTPQILSGRLGFAVAAGLYPQELGAERAVLTGVIDRLRQGQPAHAKATLIRLPLITELVPEQDVLDEFLALAHIMLAFARRIRRCEIHYASGMRRTVAWQEIPLSMAPGICLGMLEPVDGSPIERTRAMVIRTDVHKGALLTAVGARGVLELPATIPGVWVTAPTLEDHGLGFALNGPFDLDVGRAQLSRTSDQNPGLARSLGQSIGERLVQLFVNTQGAAWWVFCHEAHLAGDLTPYAFWSSLWNTMTTPKARQAFSSNTILRQVLWGEPGHPRGIGKLIYDCAALPTGLFGEHRCLARVGDIAWYTTGSVGKEDTFGQVVRWPLASQRMRPGQVVSEQVADALGSVLPNSTAARPLNLAFLLQQEIGRTGNVSVEVANQLGSLVTPEYLNSLERAEQEEIRESVKGFYFRARDGKYHASRDLVIACDDSGEAKMADEPLRAQFAPDDRVLTTDYVGPALLFFRACRQQLVAPAREMARWAIDADADAKRLAVLKYILEGEQHRELAAELRPQMEGTWLVSVAYSKLWTGFDYSEQLQLRGLLRLPDVLVIDDWPMPLPQPTPEQTLEEIYRWWQGAREIALAGYNRAVYPDGKPTVTDRHFDPSSPDHRRQWLTLFVLGSSYTSGRTQIEQTRGFIVRCQEKGWLDTFSHPKLNAEAWIRVIEGYLEEQTDVSVFYQWMKQFVTIFQFARWMSDYAGLFLDVERYHRPFGLDELLSPRTSPAQQGGGYDAPPAKRALGIGACFVMRELVRSGVVASSLAYEHCYPPTQQLRDFFIRLGCDLDGTPDVNSSRKIYSFLCEHIGAERATFDQCFDLPFLLYQRYS